MAVLTTREREDARANLSRRNTESTGTITKAAWQTVIDDMDKLIDSRLFGTDIRDATAKAEFSEVLMLDCLVVAAEARRARSLRSR